ncbi:thiolase domain-containing protein [Nocardioides mangrovi]|uniref:Thiolase domain-containing protein n=1 Tax=Nocardioides mangrovi TaxID=2874580 RepID=A0ABS7UEY5_9ACTN|nr:thiolase domain-containing protein [Nocardioides mangrovi]MBZ5739571.1 thiolase domain-containing protein [Nocardioides mangrovi]
MSDCLITGWAHSRFGKLDEDLEALVVGVVVEAIASAGLEPDAIGAIYYGQFNAGLHPLAFASSLALQAGDGLWGTPATRVENACASGAAAVHQGLLALRSGAARQVLVVGAEKMTHAGADVIGASLLGADYDSAGGASSSGFAGLFAAVADEYARRYGDCSDTLGTIAAKSHRNALGNPYAHLRKPLGEDFCRTESAANPRVAGLLRRTDCSPVSDGAAALVLSTERSSSARAQAVRFLGVGQANDHLPGARRDPLAFAASRLAWDRALAMAGIGVGDLAFLEVHDCFTIAELVLYETLGLAAPGEGRRLLDDGTVALDGSLPVNPSGGLKSKGHPVGATGVSQLVLTAMQLTGTAGAMQLDRADRAAVHNMGGLAVANYVSILEAV